MNVAIIGSGNVGRALATSLTRAGHHVTITATHPDHAVEAAKASGAEAVESNGAAIEAGDVVILAVPGTAFDSIAEEVGEKLTGKVVIDVSNRQTPDPSGPGTSAAEELQARLPGAAVAKAFNTLFATRQADPVVDGRPADGYVAATDESAKKAVLSLVESIGLRPVDAGPLPAARTLEGMAWLNINRALQGGSWQDAWMLVGPDAQN
jgi:predicted dinucleotide-binding enzyme